MSYTMEDFKRDYIKEHFAQLTLAEKRETLERLSPEDRRELLETLPPEERLAGLSEEQVRQLLHRLTRRPAAQPRKPRRKR